MSTHHSHARPLIAILNSTQEIMELLQTVLEEEGFSTVTAYTADFKRGTLDIQTFFQTHQPQAIVYDIALPYEENWHFFCNHIITTKLLPESHFILTTTNKSVLDMLVGPTPTIEIIGRPFDLEEIVSAIRRVILRD
jgi:DNA-binding response OmpR family regulator